MTLTIRDTLLWYKRPDVRAAMIAGATNKEIGIRFGEGFGKRPDALLYEQEVLQAVQRGATSFHASEELWQDPLSIETGMGKQRSDELRTGWDLVLDIDFTHFGATKLITKALCVALEDHGVTEYGLKFSGNKGFHIGVAWESFPKEWNGEQMKHLFPDAPRAIADYLVEYIDNADTGFALSEQLRTLLGEEESAKHARRVCATCGRDRKSFKRTQYFECTSCGRKGTLDEIDPNVPVCPNAECGKLVFVHAFAQEQKDDAKCECGSTETREVFDLKIDTQLIASRHLYRLEYSMHEKSGLVSIPIPSTHLMDFFRDEARPDRIRELLPFWYRDAPDQGYGLLVRAMARARGLQDENASAPREIVWEADAAPEEAFPPTIKKMLGGMTDGKKRGLFILTNFLASVGWNADMIEDRLKEWNTQNPEPMREGDIHNHIRYFKQKNQKVLPPNFANPIYKDLGVLVEDELTRRCKNPVQYVRMRLKQSGVSTTKDQSTK